MVKGPRFSVWAASRFRAVGEPVTALAVYVAVAFILFASAWVNPGFLSIGQPGDAQIYMWMLGWVPYSISHGLNPLFSDYVVSPQGASLLWSLIPIVPGFILSPVMSLAGPVVTYNLTMTLGPALSAWCAYIAFRSLIGGGLGSWMGGLLYGFSPYMLGHALGSPNLVICVTPPLALLLLYDLCVRNRWSPWRVGVALGLVGALQLLTTPEILLTTGLIGSPGLLVLALLNLKSVASPGRIRRIAIGLGSALLVFVVLSAAPLLYMFLGPQQVHGVVRQQDFFVTDLTNLFVPTELMLFAPKAAVALSNQWTGDIAEANAYVGVPMLGLLIFIAWRFWQRIVVRWSALTGMLITLLSFGPHLHIAGQIHFHVVLPWAALQLLPLLDNVLPARLMLFFYLVAGLALAFFVTELRRAPLGWRSAAGWALIGLGFLLLLPNVPYPVTENPVPGFFAGSEVQRIPAGSVALIAPFSTAPGFQLGPGQGSATYPMLWQQASGMRFRMPEGAMNVPDVNGRPTGGRPPASSTQSLMIAIQQGGSPPTLTQSLRAAVDADLERWRVQTVIVGPMFNQPAMLNFFSNVLGSRPQLDAGVYVWWNIQQAYGSG